MSSHLSLVVDNTPVASPVSPETKKNKLRAVMASLAEFEREMSQEEFFYLLRSCGLTPPDYARHKQSVAK